MKFIKESPTELSVRDKHCWLLCNNYFLDINLDESAPLKKYDCSTSRAGDFYNVSGNSIKECIHKIYDLVKHV